MIKNLVIDMDDTLLDCSPNYDAMRDEFIDTAYARTGMPKEIIRNLLNAIDSTNGQLHHFTKERWPLSFGATSAAIDAFHHKEVDRKATQEAYDIGNKVFDCSYPPLPGILETLDKYHNAGYNLILYTKGDLGVQKKKIAENKLWKYFSGANIYIVDRKNGDAVRKIINEQYILPAETCVIGDNFREDVQSAIDAKVMAIHIDPTYNLVQPYVDHFILNSFAEVPRIIPIVSAFANIP